MSWRQFGLALVCIAIVGLGVAWVAGRQSMLGTGAPPKSLDAVRLGPEPGQPVAPYLASLPAKLPPPGAPGVPALVQLSAEVDPADAVALLTGTGVSVEKVVFRVPLPKVQTALRFEPLPPVDLPDPAEALARRLALARESAQRAAGNEAGSLGGRQARVARYEAAVLAGPGRSVLAVLVLGQRGGLVALAGRPGVRAVDAAPEGTPVTGVALAPLLPEQTESAAAVPDDGPVPAAPVPAGS